MTFDILCRLPSFRVTSNAPFVWILVDTNVIEAHSCRKQRRESRKVDSREATRHTKVHDKGHGLDGDEALSDVSIGAEGSSVDLPGLFVADKPGDFAFCSRDVFECVDLVFLAIIPIVIEVRECGYGLLVRTTAVWVYGGDMRVVELGEIYR